MTVLRDEDNSSDILVGFTVACEPHLIAHRKSIEQMQLESRIRRLNTFKLVDETDEDLGLVHNRLQKIEVKKNHIKMIIKKLM